MVTYTGDKTRYRQREQFIMEEVQNKLSNLHKSKDAAELEVVAIKREDTTTREEEVDKRVSLKGLSVYP